MKDSSLRLQDKTILLTGPFNGITQNLIRTFTEFGCDIAFVSDQSPNATRYCEGITEAREVHADYGRAVHFHLPLKTEKDVKEVLGAMANGFGRTDVLVDASPLQWTADTDMDNAIALSRLLAEQVIPFLAAKQKGRIMYVFEDECLERLKMPGIPAALRTGIQGLMGDLARAQAAQKITVNSLSLGVTEDYILRHFAKAGSIRKSMDELAKQHAGLKLVESTDVGLGAAYLASALSGSLTGSTLRLTHGFHLQ